MVLTVLDPAASGGNFFTTKLWKTNHVPTVSISITFNPAGEFLYVRQTTGCLRKTQRMEHALIRKF